MMRTFAARVSGWTQAVVVLIAWCSFSARGPRAPPSTGRSRGRARRPAPAPGRGVRGGTGPRPDAAGHAGQAPRIAAGTPGNRPRSGADVVGASGAFCLRGG